MLKNKVYEVSLILFFLLFSSLAFSINSDQWLIQNIQVEDGLPESTVFSVQQDTTGYIWFGTINGVARFDGYDFKVYNHNRNDESTISNNNAGNLFIDSHNVLWIGTFGGGFNTIDLNTGHLKRYPYSNKPEDLLVSKFVQTFHEDKEGNMWIGTPFGLYQFSNQVINHYKHIEGNNNTLINSRVWRLAEDETGDIWVATSQGLSQLNPKSKKINNFPLPEELVSDISSKEFRSLYIYQNKLVIGTSSGLLIFNLDSKQYQSFPLKYNIKVNDMIMVKDKLLIGTIEGLYQFELNKSKFVRDEAGELWRELQLNDIRDMLIDDSGLIWLTTRDSGVLKIDPIGGLFKKSKTPFNSINKEQNKKIWAIQTDDQETIYLGTSDTVLKKTVDGKIRRIKTKTHNEIPGRIRALKLTDDQNLWIGSSEGLFYLEKGDDVAKEIIEPFKLIGIKPADIYSIEEADSGELWFSLHNLGILRWNPVEKTSELIQKYQEKSLLDYNLGKVFQDSNKNIWIGSNLIGLIKFDIENEVFDFFEERLYQNEGISSNRVRDIYEDSQSRLWIATSRGLNLYLPDTNSFQVFDDKDGLLDESPFIILEDDKQNIWLSHSFGASRLSSKLDEIQSFKINSSIRKDGLNIRSGAIDKNNILYFGSVNGLYTFDTNDFESCKLHQPKLEITSAKIDNRELNPMNIDPTGYGYHLYYQDRAISFKVAALEFNSSDQVQYSYKVAELGDVWKDISISRSIELKQLNPGNYVLEIKAMNPGCSWSEQRLKVNIRVHPVWWDNNWIKLAFLLILTMFGVMFHYYRNGVIRKQNRQLEEQVAERTSELLLLNKKLQQASQTDFLTGLYNRKGFIKIFNERQTGHSTLVLTDIDNFKTINDIYGHSAGDQVLISISEIMLSLISKQDFVGRWGGEEFIFYMEGKNAEESFEVVEQIRIAIQQAKISHSHKEIPVTATFGICKIHEGMSLNEAISAADIAMYSGKSKGRNVTVIY